MWHAHTTLVILTPTGSTSNVGYNQQVITSLYIEKFYDKMLS